jgi:hypothetical protein
MYIKFALKFVLICIKIYVMLHLILSDEMQVV